MIKVQVVSVVLLIAIVKGRFIKREDVEDRQLIQLTKPPSHSGNHLQKLQLLSADFDFGRASVLRSDSGMTLPLGEHGMAKMLLKSSESGYIAADSVGVSVTKGATATLTFSLSVKGVPADFLAKNDSLFKDALSEEDLEDYADMSDDYSGGLQIPFLKWFGVNLDNNVGDADERNVEPEDESISAESSAARQILEGHDPQDILISGSRIVEGSSHVPKTYYAFVKVAKVQLLNGAKVLVISSKAEDVATATSDISSPDFGADTYQMTQEVDI